MTSEHYLAGIAAYRELFWPTFVEHDGCVLLSSDEKIYREWFDTCGGDRGRVEATMNHRHILDVLPQAIEEPTRELVLTFGRLLREAWEAKLRRDFPERVFTVSFPEDYSEDLVDYDVTFWQERKQT